MGNRVQPTARWPKPRFLILVVVPLVGLSLLFIRAFSPNGSSSWSPRKWGVGTDMRSFPIVKPTPDCCTTHYAPSLSQDSRGWLLDPVSAASRAGISGAATDCKSIHVGQIVAGGVRGNHRHHLCNETLLVWGAEAKFRVENPFVAKGYVETWIKVDEVGILGCPAGRAHALVNMDSINTLHLVGCQDGLADPSNTDYNIWTNLSEHKWMKAPFVEVGSLKVTR